jgi:glycosyltransferase involved in cell wall biosynthesis
LFVRVPPERYGGTERVIHALATELRRRGHDVVMFAAGTSDWPQDKLVATSPKPLWQMSVADQLAYRILQVEDVVCRSGDFDVIHAHLDYMLWPVADRMRTPMVTTLHGRLDIPELRPLFAAYRDQPLVSISDCQRKPVADLDLNWAATIHHGFRLRDIYSLGKGDGGYLAFLGRISPEKGLHTAIRVALRAGMPLKIAAFLDPINQSYFDQEVKPLLDHPLIEYLGELDDRGKAELLPGAAALLLPIDWDEPFGIAFIEAMAAGTPTIARPRGSLPELMKHGEHGFLVWTEDEMVDAVKRIGEIDRKRCRSHVLERFSVGRMAEGYEWVFRRVAARAAAATATTKMPRGLKTFPLGADTVAEPVPRAGNGAPRIGKPA